MCSDFVSSCCAQMKMSAAATLKLVVHVDIHLSPDTQNPGDRLAWARAALPPSVDSWCARALAAKAARQSDAAAEAGRGEDPPKLQGRRRDVSAATRGESHGGEGFSGSRDAAAVSGLTLPTRVLWNSTRTDTQAADIGPAVRGQPGPNRRRRIGRREHSATVSRPRRPGLRRRGKPPTNGLA